jgi:hypothetical protein
MSDADELARRYLTLWTQYLTALLADPRTLETVKRWMAFAGQFSSPTPQPGETESTPVPAWPPFFGPFGPPPAPAAELGDRIAELVRRVDELERRLAALERKPRPRRVRSETRTARH